MKLKHRSPHTKLLVGVCSHLLQEKSLVTEDAKDLGVTVIGRKEYHK